MVGRLRGRSTGTASSGAGVARTITIRGMTTENTASNPGGSVRTSSITVDSLNAHLARPEDDGGAGMLLLPMITGIDEQVRGFANDVAAAGMTALAWDPWHGPSADDTSRERLFELLGQLDDEAVLAEQSRLLDHMFTELGLRKVGVIGWCLGGRFAFLLAGRDQRVANAVAYHPTVPIPPAANHDLDAAEYAGRISAPAMMLYPGQDSIVPRDSFDALQEALNGRESGESIVHLYPAAEHGFADPERRKKQVNADAYDLSWPQAVAFMQVTTRS